MVSKTNWKAWVVLGAAVALFATSGGILMASNMGFKINTALQNGFIAPGPKGDNWRAIPWVSPNTTYTAMCNTFAAAGATKANVTIAQINASTGAATSANCAVGSATAIDPTRGVRVRITGGVAPASPTNIVLVGSSNESASFPILQGGFVAPGPKGDNWLGIPYHTTWTKAQDICTSYGFVLATGVTVARIDAASGAATSFTCGLTANNFNLVIGEAIRIRKTTAGNPAALLPPHF
ncbi:MAG TPA: hypothetical protein VFW45_17050 [Candidatus Polarisedimenticolia bacterium]|nr:hypothetical protein [Candidatus Polarisedimenticolia bacterium]